MTSNAMALELFSPFVRNGQVDMRLLRALGIPPGDYDAHFDKVLDPAEGTTFDFYLEAESGRRYFFDVKRSEPGFATCADDDGHREKLERHYGPHLHERVDARWLEPALFFPNCELLGHLSYLGRYDESGVVFIFPKSNEGLMKAEETIKQIVSKTLAPRVAVLYLEYLIGRILETVAEDVTLREHFLKVAAKHAPPPR